MEINLDEIIAPSFYDLSCDIDEELYTHYLLKGGRGSTKSSFISIMIVLGMMEDPKANAIVCMKYHNQLRDSVHEQIAWAIEILGVAKFWEIGYSPLVFTYKATGQRIAFRGAEKPKKTKGVNFAKGYCKYIWYEELDQFSGMEDIRVLNQTFIRGGDKFTVFYSYNPPKSSRSWVNAEAKIPRDDRITHHSDYRDVPVGWIGKPFIIEAEHLKSVNVNAYEHEYLGYEVGTGLEIFNNVNIEVIPQKQIDAFDRSSHGIDWGYAIDPAVYGKMTYDKTRRRLYMYGEISGLGLSNRILTEKIIATGYQRKLIIADSAEPKSIDECRGYGLNIIGAKKGPGSIEFGIKWLQDLETITIDPTRCPLAAKEFINYSLEIDNQGNVRNKYPDKDNHAIDMTRYAMQNDMQTNTWGFDN